MRKASSNRGSTHLCGNQASKQPSMHACGNQAAVAARMHTNMIKHFQGGTPICVCERGGRYSNRNMASTNQVTIEGWQGSMGACTMGRPCYLSRTDTKKETVSEAKPFARFRLCSSTLASHHSFAPRSIQDPG